MKIHSGNRAAQSRPKDQSLAAYKAWIIEIAAQLTTKKTMVELTEQEWIESWKEYWQQKPKR